MERESSSTNLIGAEMNLPRHISTSVKRLSDSNNSKDNVTDEEEEIFKQVEDCDEEEFEILNI